MALSKVVAIRFDGPEGDAAESVNFEDELLAGRGGDDEYVGFFAGADLVANAVESALFLVGM